MEGLYGPHENEDSDLCQKQTIPGLKWGRQNTHQTLKYKNNFFHVSV